jgi:hypothetical protein
LLVYFTGNLVTKPAVTDSWIFLPHECHVCRKCWRL